MIFQDLKGRSITRGCAKAWGTNQVAEKVDIRVLSFQDGSKTSLGVQPAPSDQRTGVIVRVEVLGSMITPGGARHLTRILEDAETAAFPLEGWAIRG